MTLSLSACFSELSLTNSSESVCCGGSWGKIQILPKDHCTASATSTETSLSSLTLLTYFRTEPQSSCPHSSSLVTWARLVNSFIQRAQQVQHLIIFPSGSPSSLFPSLLTDRNIVLRFHVRVASHTERAENAESTIWINLSFGGFNCIIEIQGCAPETLIRYYQFPSWVH